MVGPFTSKRQSFGAASVNEYQTSLLILDWQVGTGTPTELVAAVLYPFCVPLVPDKAIAPLHSLLAGISWKSF